MCVRRFVHLTLCIYVLSGFLSVYPSTCLSISTHIFPSGFPSVFLYVPISHCPSVCSTIGPSVYGLFVSLSVLPLSMSSRIILISSADDKRRRRQSSGLSRQASRAETTPASNFSKQTNPKEGHFVFHQTTTTISQQRGLGRDEQQGTCAQAKYQKTFDVFRRVSASLSTTDFIYTEICPKKKRRIT